MALILDCWSICLAYGYCLRKLELKRFFGQIFSCQSFSVDLALIKLEILFMISVLALHDLHSEPSAVIIGDHLPLEALAL